MIISQEVYDSAKKLAKSKGFKLRFVNNKICFLHFELSNDKGNVLKFCDFYDMVKHLEGKKNVKEEIKQIHEYKNVSIFDL